MKASNAFDKADKALEQTPEWKAFAKTLRDTNKAHLAMRQTPEYKALVKARKAKEKSQK